MRQSYIAQIIQTTPILATFIGLLLACLLIVIYVAVAEKITAKKAAGSGRFIAQAVLIVYVIFLWTVSSNATALLWSPKVEWTIFHSYLDSWHQFSMKRYVQLIGQIVMWIPVGLVIPFIFKRPQKSYTVIGIALMLALIIEIIQYVFNRGVADIDDVLNAIIGAIIGYGLYSAGKNRRRGFQKIALGFLPLILTICVFAGTYAFYIAKPYGNLAIASGTPYKMTNATIIKNLEVSNEQSTAPVYKGENWSEERATQFAKAFYNKLGIPTKNMEHLENEADSTFQVEDEESFALFVNKPRGTYEYTNYTLIKKKNADVLTEEQVRQKLSYFDIKVSMEADFKMDQAGNYHFALDKIEEDRYVSGTIEVSFLNSEPKHLLNNLATFEKVADVPIQSEKEALLELERGHFVAMTQTVEKLTIQDVKLRYTLDSKGYYQPYYAFNVILNGTETTLGIPALK